MKSILIILLISISISLQAQDQDLDKVFDDGGISNIKNSVFISASDLVEGFFTVGYTRYVGESSSLGLAFGLYLYSGPAMHWSITSDDSFYNSLNEIDYDKGFMFHFIYRSYFADHDGFFWQYGLMYKSRKISTVSYNFLAVPELKFGYSLSVLKNIKLSANGGLGFGFYILKDTSISADIADVDMSLYFPINVEVAYVF